MTERPLIGVTTSEVRVAENVNLTREGEPPQREMVLGLRYLQAIEQAGGLPVVLPPLDAVEPLLSRLGGVCLSGGPDLDPDSYGARRHRELGPTEPELDRFELALARHADARGMPILAICRGAQALNVARGGTLLQHLPEEPGSSVEHRQREPGERATHEVAIAADSRLALALGERRVDVNSFHHQGAKRLGRGLRAVAWAPDGVIEGIEAPDRDFVVGVQWHAEFLAHRADQAALFSEFVAAASSFGTRRTHLAAA